VRYKRRVTGVSLLELMVVLAIITSLGAMAVPTTSRWIDEWKVTVLANTLLADLHLARSEAIRRGAPVVVCSSSAGGCGTAGLWEQGWLVFVDANNNAMIDDGEDLLRHSAIESARHLMLRGNGPVQSYVSYHPLGQTRLVNGAFQAGTLTLCPASYGATRARRIVINSGGRPRVDRVAADTVCGR
jgi:type IV fimbrial biogenesis protein FimT